MLLNHTFEANLIYWSTSNIPQIGEIRLKLMIKNLSSMKSSHLRKSTKEFNKI